MPFVWCKCWSVAECRDARASEFLPKGRCRSLSQVTSDMLMRWLSLILVVILGCSLLRVRRRTVRTQKQFNPRYQTSPPKLPPTVSPTHAPTPPPRPSSRDMPQPTTIRSISTQQHSPVAICVTGILRGIYFTARGHKTYLIDPCLLYTSPSPRD